MKSRANPVRVIVSRRPLADPRVQALRDLLHGGGLTAAGAKTGGDVERIVRGIIGDVRRRGDAALVALERRLDGAKLTPRTLRVPASSIKAALRAADPRFLALVRRAAANIRSYQRSILHKDPPALRRGGRALGVRYLPIERVGIYVPGWRAFYPSTVLMTVIPAQVAGVRELAIASPPLSNGDVNPMVLALAGELGVTEVYRLGGAQALAAMALGTKSVRRVDKIAGPGNAFVAEAKRQLLGRVGIDLIAGPSEVLIIADGSAEPEWVAADMVSQAEHDPGSAVLVTDSARLAARVSAAVGRRIASSARAAALRRAFRQYCAIVVVPDMRAACAVANEFAAEHVEIMTRRPEALLGSVRNAGAVFLGPCSPVVVGDYFAGPSHVLPTGGTARFSGPLSCNDFLKASSIVRYDAASIERDARYVEAFAMREKLPGHGESAMVRLSAGGGRRRGRSGRRG